MDNSGSIVEFFYNIVPGSLFLVLLNYRYNFKITEALGFDPNQATLTVFSYIVVGLFMGFVFQAVTKFVRNHFGWNRRIARKVINNNLDKFKNIYHEIYNEKCKDSNLIPCKRTEEIFYFLDCSLRGGVPGFLPTHFSSRFAFWANIFFALIFLIIIDLSKNSFSEYALILICISIIVFYFADQYFEGFWDTIFKTFYVKYILPPGR